MVERRINGQAGRRSGTWEAEESFEVEEIEFDPTRRGYTLIPNYFKHFWTPLIGLKAAATYEMICSFAHGKKEECYPSVGLLADTLGVDRHDLTGRIRRDGRPGHQEEYYQKGVFESLAEHGLVQTVIEERNGTSHYRFKILKSPPLLTPEQLAQLPKRLQRRHHKLLKSCRRARKEFTPSSAPETQVPPQGGANGAPVGQGSMLGGCDAATGGYDAATGGYDAATGYKNNTYRTEPNEQISLSYSDEREPKENFHLAQNFHSQVDSHFSPQAEGASHNSLPSSPTAPVASVPADSSAALRRKLAKEFYTIKLGQPQVSREKVEEGVKVMVNLESQGFSLEQITWGMEWIARHPEKFDGEVHSLSLLPYVIGQALKEAKQVKRVVEKKQQREEEEQRLREEQARRVALAELYRSLPDEEQTSLQEKAVEGLIQQGIKRTFLVESLIKGEVYRLLGERCAQEWAGGAG